MELFKMSFGLGNDTESVYDHFEEFFYLEVAKEKDDPLDERSEDEILEMLSEQMKVFSHPTLFAEGIRQGLEDQKAKGKIFIPEGMSDARAIARLCTEAGAVITGRDGRDNTEITAKNWLSGKKHPRHSEDVREDVFRLCFALKFNEEQTAEFFVKCYLDRPFNYRSLREAVYYFCLKTGKNYATAQEIILKIGNYREESPVQETLLIEKALNEADDTDTFVRYMIAHRSSFDRPSKTIEQNLKKLYDKCYEKARIEHPDIFKKTIRNVLTAIYKYPSEIHGKSDEKQSVSVYRKSENMRIPPLVSASMLKHTDSKLFSNNNYSEGSNQTIRKALILLNFYQYMASKTVNIDFSPEYRINRFWNFVYNTDDLLQECGFVHLYWRNPYDWFFLFCSATSNPLETFRSFSDPSDVSDD